MISVINDPVNDNSKILQSPLSNVCGQYCVAFLLLRCNGLIANGDTLGLWIGLRTRGRSGYPEGCEAVRTVKIKNNKSILNSVARGRSRRLGLVYSD